VNLADSKDDSRLRGVIGRHLHLHLIADHETDETFPHFSRNMGEHLVSTGQFDFEHRACKNGRNRALNLNRLFLIGLGTIIRILTKTAFSTTLRAASSTTKISWLSDNISRLDKQSAPDRCGEYAKRNSR